MGILAFKGFTTITNSGSEIKDPHRNVGRAIMISIALCVVIYALVGFAVASNLSLSEIIETKDYSLAAAARPALGEAAVWFTVILAMLATAGGIIASIFAVSRMLAMLTEMELVPHRHFHMPGSIQKHTLVYTVVLGLVLTAFFDLSRIAALGIIFYLIMDIAVHWGGVASSSQGGRCQPNRAGYCDTAGCRRAGRLPLGESDDRSPGANRRNDCHGGYLDCRATLFVS